MSRNSDDELKKWLETRFKRIDQRIDNLESSLVEKKERKISIAWLRTLETMSKMDKNVGTEDLAERVGISRSVISEYLNRMEEEGLISREINTDPKVKARYLWQIDWESLPKDINSRLKKKSSS